MINLKFTFRKQQKYHLSSIYKINTKSMKLITILKKKKNPTFLVEIKIEDFFFFADQRS